MKSLSNKILVIGHRGACALRPEHTLASYATAIENGADFIEPDLVMTRDGVLVARHENEISGTTDVASRPEFAARKTAKIIDGKMIGGWFTEDFTLADLQTLRARERLPELRPANSAFDGQFTVPTFDEIIDFVAAQSHAQQRVIGIYPEIKHSTYFRALGLPMEDAVLAAIRRHRYTAHHAPLFIQSFETANLKHLRVRIGNRLSNIKLIQLLGHAHEYPYDMIASPTRRGGQRASDSAPTIDGAAASSTAIASTDHPSRYADLMRPAGLHAIAQYADAIGPDKLAVIPRKQDGSLGQPTALVADAHAENLLVHPYTFRPENFFLPAQLQSPGNAQARCDAGAVAEIRAYLDAGIDGFFIDDPALGRAALLRD